MDTIDASSTIKTAEPVNTNVKLSFLTKLGYSMASIGDSVIVDFIGAFFIFFLTGIVGINPALAGTISLIAVLWDAISDPIIGVMSDRSKSKYGKRRPFIVAAVLPVMLLMILIFTKVDFGPVWTFVYYVFIAILYWTAYTMFNIPYMALGSSLTTDEDERTKLSSVRQSMAYIGLICAGALPAVLIDAIHSSGVSEPRTYTLTAVILGAISAITILITWLSTRGKELRFEGAPETKQPVIQVIADLFKIKSYLFVVLAAIFMFIGFTLFTSDVIFVITVLLGLSEASAGIVFTLVSLSGIVLAMIIAKTAQKVDKKHVFVVSVIISGVCMIAIRFVGFTSLTTYICYIFVANIGITAFLVLVHNFLYDVVEVIDIKTGSRSSGAVFSYYSFVIKVGKALALQILGILLAVGGYDAELATQSQQALDSILSITTVYPGILFIISGVIMSFNPNSRRKIDAVKAAIAKRNSGEEYSTEEFASII